MTDIVSLETRRRMMSGIQGKNTKPEIEIRTALHRDGYRYRLHVKSLPGKPDLVLPKYQAVIQINGCFWHGHNCHLFKWPSTRPDFWKQKISSNRGRDKKNRTRLRHLGWRVLTIWECALKGRQRIPLPVLIGDVKAWLASEEESKEIRGKEYRR